MRKLIFLIAISISSYCYLLAQQPASAANSNYGTTFAKGYQASDLYQIELIRAEKTGYAIQVGSFASYPNVVKYVTNLQGKWIKNVLLKLDESDKNKTLYKVLIGPFSDKAKAVQYQKDKGLKGFVTSLAKKAIPKTASTPPRKANIPREFQAKSATINTATFSQRGEATYYAKKYHGKITASGEPFNMYAFTAAHWTLPFNTIVEVCRVDNKKCVRVRVNDKGPNPSTAIGRDGKPKVIDLSLVAAESIGLVQAGSAQVQLRVVSQSPPPPIDLESPEFREKAAPPKKVVQKATSYFQTGEASYYSAKFHGRMTASGEPFDMNALTAAHWTLPFGTLLEVCRLDNQKCVRVRVNDRGPNPAKAIARDGKPRVLDLSLAAAQQIDLVRAGLAQVSIKVLK